MVDVAVEVTASQVVSEKAADPNLDQVAVAFDDLSAAIDKLRSAFTQK